MARSLLVRLRLLLMMAMIVMRVLLLRLCAPVSRVYCRSLRKTRSFAGVGDVFDARTDGYHEGGEAAIRPM